MYWFKFKWLIINIYYLNQRISCFVIKFFFLRKILFNQIPTFFCCCKWVVSVTHNKSNVAIIIIFLFNNWAICQAVKFSYDIVAVCNFKTSYMSSVHIQIKVINNLHILFVSIQFFNYFAFFVVNQHHNVRHFKFCMFSYFNSCRQSWCHSFFSSFYIRIVFVCVLILFQVNFHHKSKSNFTIVQSTLNKNNGIKLIKHIAIQII